MNEIETDIKKRYRKSWEEKADILVKFDMDSDVE